MKEMILRNEKIFNLFTDKNTDNKLFKSVKEYDEFFPREQK